MPPTASPYNTVVPVVEPAPMTIVLGVFVQSPGLAAQIMLTPPVGAACDNVKVSVVERPKPTVVDPLGVTVTTVVVAVALVMPV